MASLVYSITAVKKGYQSKQIAPYYIPIFAGPMIPKSLHLKATMDRFGLLRFRECPRTMEATPTLTAGPHHVEVALAQNLLKWHPHMSNW